MWLFINIMGGISLRKSSLQINFEGTLIGHKKFKFSIMVAVSKNWCLVLLPLVFGRLCLLAFD